MTSNVFVMLLLVFFFLALVFSPTVLCIVSHLATLFADPFELAFGLVSVMLL